MKPFRQRSLNYTSRGASLTTILSRTILLSTISAIYTGIWSRNNVPAAPPGTPNASAGVNASTERTKVKQINHDNAPSIRTLQDLTPSELYPKAGLDRHIVDPPQDIIPVKLVECTTTVGYLHVSCYCQKETPPR